MAENNEILVCGEVEEGRMSRTTKELLGAGRRLAGELKGKLSTLLVGSGIRACGEEAIAYGADKVYLVDDAQLSQYNPESFTAAITQACQQIAPSVVLLGHTIVGCEVAPRIAYRLGCFACTACIKIDIDPDRKLLIQTRAVYGGNAVAVIVSKDSRPQLVTIKPRAVAPLEPDSSRKGEIEDVKVKVDPLATRTKLVDTIMQEIKGVRLEDAEVVVAGGGGIGGAEGFKLLEELVKIWRGAIGSTTVPCDEGWLPATSTVIGISGKTVKPNLYFAVGIRGAGQHVVGCSESKCIVAINTDPDATMFKLSDYGIVGDYRVIIPELIEECKKVC